MPLLYARIRKQVKYRFWPSSVNWTAGVPPSLVFNQFGPKSIASGLGIQPRASLLSHRGAAFSIRFTASVRFSSELA